MSRRKSREIVVKLLYQIQFNDDDINEQINYLLEEEKVKDKEADYIKDIVLGTVDNIEEIDAKIEENSKKRKIDRISKVNLAILRSSIYEMERREDIPVKVTINEAVVLAKEFSTDDSASFINGLLGNIANGDNNE